MVKSDPQIIKSTAFDNRVADLRQGQKNGDIIVDKNHCYESRPNPGYNQRFTFMHDHGNEYRIATFDSNGDRAFVSSTDPSAGGTLVGGEESSLYTVETYCRISTRGNDGKPLFWTLDSGDMYTKITLQPAKNDANQLWALLNV